MTNIHLPANVHLGADLIPPIATGPCIIYLVQRRSSIKTLLRELLVLIALSVLIFAPRPLSGLLDLAQARRAVIAGHYAEAAFAYQSAAERLPWQPSLWERAGVAAMKGNEIQEALSSLEKARAHRALSGEGWLALGDLYEQDKDPEAALSADQQASVHGADAAAVQMRMERLERSQGDFASAGGAARLWVLAAPKNAQAHYQLGQLLMASQPEDALAELGKAAQLDPKLDAPVASLRASLSPALQVNDRSYELVVAGRALASLGEWDLAAEAFRSATSARADYAEAWAWLGEANQHIGKDGLTELQRAVALNPDSALVQSLYGIYWQRQGQAVQALKAFQNAVNLEPQNAAWQVAVGSAYEQSGNLVAALGAYQLAVALAPSDAMTWRALAAFSVNYNSDVAGTGLPAVQHLLSLAPDDWQSYDIAGLASFDLENWKDAEQQFSKAVQLAPSQVAPRLHLGMAFLLGGDQESALKNLVAVSTLDPAGPAGEQAIRLLDRYFPGWH